MSLKSNLAKIKSELYESSASLIAVSKTKPSSMVKELFDLGQVDFGENKVQELSEKAKELSGLGVKWHFIGRLQTNKLNLLLSTPNLASIHSIDSIKLLDKILSKKLDRVIELFIQINTSSEVEKSGFDLDFDFSELISRIDEHENFKFKGFMTIGKIRTEEFEVDANKSFKDLQTLRDKYGQQLHLSMGMSKDFKIALKYDTNWVRVGSAIFGER